jgi:GST-like protein
MAVEVPSTRCWGGIVDKGFTVYGAAGSGSVPVEATLTLLGLPYEVVEAPTWRGPEEQAKVAPVNPMRQVPTLVLPSGEVMTESAAILIWLADAYAPGELAPAPDAPERAAFLRWMVFVPAAIYAMFWVRDVPSRLAGDDPAQQDLIKERTSERIAECWRAMGEQLTPRGDYLLGERLSVLDLYVAVASRWTPRRRRFYAEAPGLADVVRRVDAEPRLQAFWPERFPFTEKYGWEG